MSEARTTTDHDEIKEWAERLGGRPSRVRSTGDDDDPGVLRLDFGEPDEALEEITWDEFFDKFEENQLALLYGSDPEGGGESRFNKLISRKSH
jgi:hypothetical protein